MGRLSSKIREVFGIADSGSEQVIKDAVLRKSGGSSWGGLELVLPGGQVLAVVDDEVGNTIGRVHMFLARRSLKVTGVVDAAAKTIRVKKIETSSHLDGVSNYKQEA